MFHSVSFLALFVVSLALNSIDANSDTLLYGEVGGEVVLSPGSVTGPITNIMWKHDTDIAMGWFDGDTEAYRQFAARGSLNASTGQLKITGLTRNDSGIYTPEINNKVTSKTQLRVISPVSKPTISVQCDDQRTHCNWTCEGATEDAEPITYSWVAFDAGENISTKERTITETTEAVYRCTLQNPVSHKGSELVRNPLYSKGTPMLPNGLNQNNLVGNHTAGDQEASNQGLTSVVIHNTNHVTEEPASGQETSSRDQQVDNETEEPQEASTQGLTSAESHDPSNMRSMTSELQEPPPPNPDTSSDTEGSTTTSEVQEPPTAVSPETSNETESVVPKSSGQETAKEDQQLDDEAADPQHED
ncbi:SLAM family member 5 [Lates japonicus]|uniref:SLAM family member 5 n=1 Tax=Lates japonicus TaxID=270547 RepID=A0AAD3RFC4_LATJO|nr:SLAM family member 5 [Lates japonicus]